MSHADKVIEAIKAMTPEERVQSLISAGIIREDGTLMPQYGGTSTSGDIPTPETDAAYIYEMLGVAEPLVRISLARDLERRLAAATARAEEAERMIVQSQIDCLKFRTGSEAHYEALVRARLQLDLSEKNNQYLHAELDRLRKEREAERRERGLKSIDRICDTCGGEKDSEGRCAMCLQSKLANEKSDTPIVP